MGMDPVTGGVVGGGMQAVGGMIDGKKNRAAEKARDSQQRADIGVAQGRLDQYGNEYKDYQGTIPVEELLGMAGGPSTSSSSSVTNVNELMSPEAQAQDVGLTDMLRGQFERSLGEPALPQGYREGIARGGAEQIRGLKDTLSNRAAMTGGQSQQQSSLDAMLAGAPIISGVKSQISQAPMLAEQIMAQRRRQAQGFLDPRLARRTKGKTSTRGSTSSYSPGQNIQNVLGIYGTQAPQKPDIILPT